MVEIWVGSLQGGRPCHVAVSTVHFPLVAVWLGSMPTGMAVHGFILEHAMGACGMGTGTGADASDHSFGHVSLVGRGG
jgi:hypothetical protein